MELVPEQITQQYKKGSIARYILRGRVSVMSNCQLSHHSSAIAYRNALQNPTPTTCTNRVFNGKTANDYNKTNHQYLQLVQVLII